MVLTPLQYIDRIAENTVENRKLLSQDIRQRRNQVVDLQGVQYTRVITPRLDPSGKPIPQPDSAANFYISISPDMIYMERFEFKLIVEDAVGSNFRVFVDGVDVTAYLMAQYDGQWISGNGIFPSIDIHKNYDVLEAASDMYSEGKDELANMLVRPGYKQIQITANDTFGVTMSLYLKLSHMNR